MNNFILAFSIVSGFFTQGSGLDIRVDSICSSKDSLRVIFMVKNVMNERVCLPYGVPFEFEMLRKSERLGEIGRSAQQGCDSCALDTAEVVLVGRLPLCLDSGSSGNYAAIVLQQSRINRIKLKLDDSINLFRVEEHGADTVQVGRMIKLIGASREEKFRIPKKGTCAKSLSGKSIRYHAP